MQTELNVFFPQQQQIYDSATMLHCNVPLLVIVYASAGDQD
jgi:hypothetical protein